MIKTTMLILCALGAPVFAAKEKFRDDQMIRDVQSTFWEAWNKHDAKQLAGLFADTATSINPYGRVASNKDNVEKALTEEHGGIMKESQGISAGLTIQFVNRNVALVDEEVDLGGVKSAEGKTLEPQRAHLANVLTKKAGKWLIAGARLYFMATPASESAHH